MKIAFTAIYSNFICPKALPKYFVGSGIVVNMLSLSVYNKPSPIDSLYFGPVHSSRVSREEVRVSSILE
jgi:hypothetical protein